MNTATTPTTPTTLAIFDLDPERRYEGTAPRLVEVLRAFTRLNTRESYAHIRNNRGSYDAVAFVLLEF